MAEGFNSELYRKNLADSLREIHNSGDEGRQKARLLLDITKETSLYQTAKEEQQVRAAAVREASEKRKLAANGEEQQPEVESTETRESRQEALVQELLGLIASNPNYRFGLSANGSLYGKGADLGQSGYLLDQKGGSLVRRGNEYDPGADPIVYDNPGESPRPYQPFLKASKVKSGNENIVKYQGWMHWENTSNNPFTLDRRGLVLFSGALFIRNTQEAVEVVSDELYKTLSSAGTPESNSVMWKFFVDAFRKYTPDYWSYVERKWQERPGNAGKDIRNCFDQ